MHPLIKHRLQGESKKPAKIEDIPVNAPPSLKRVFFATGNPLASIQPPSTARIDWYTGFPILPMYQGNYCLLFWFDLGVPPNGVAGQNIGMTMDVQVRLRAPGSGTWIQAYITALGGIPTNGLGASANVKGGATLHYGFASIWFKTNWLEGVGAPNTSDCLSAVTWERTIPDWIYQPAFFIVSNTNFRVPQTTNATKANVPTFDLNINTVNPFGVNAACEFQFKLQAGPIAVTVPLTTIELRRVDLYYDQSRGFA